MPSITSFSFIISYDSPWLLSNASYLLQIKILNSVLQYILLSGPSITLLLSSISSTRLQLKFFLPYIVQWLLFCCSMYAWDFTIHSKEKLSNAFVQFPIHSRTMETDILEMHQKGGSFEFSGMDLRGLVHRLWTKWIGKSTMSSNKFMVAPLIMLGVQKSTQIFSV